MRTLPRPGRTLRHLVIFGAPLLFLITGLLHLVPGLGEGDSTYDLLRDYADLWITIHVVQLFLIALMAWAMVELLRDLTDRAAQVARLALVPYLVFYSAFDAVVGLANGLVIAYGRGLPATQQTIMPGVSDALADVPSQPVVLTIVAIGGLSWAVTLIATARSVGRAGAPRTASVALVVSAVVGALDHAAPFGTVAMLSFLVGAYVLEFNWRTKTGVLSLESEEEAGAQRLAG